MPHPFVEAWFRWNYLRPGVTMDDLMECWRRCPHDCHMIRTLHVHALHARTSQKRAAARFAIEYLLEAERHDLQ